ncbi:MAG TPA: hypothetical protein VG960_09005 [Caulobacteraceae bacterium]|nr:hypothetical protein [Caulobacteraceae bacterium]
MSFRRVLCGALALLIAAGAATATGAQTPAAPPQVGQKLKDSKGAVVGEVEKVIADADGRPRQVLIRVTRVLRVLPLDSLVRSGDGYVTVLSRAELEALPPAD